jgi:hypothetical protein
MRMTLTGFSVHAGVHLPAGEREKLERLCRYMARTPLTADRLKRLKDGRLSYRLKAVWRDGTTHVIFEPLELLEKLAVLIPLLRKNLIRLHGVLAPAAKWRAWIVPSPASAETCRCDGQRKRERRHRKNYAWAELMRRVFDVDVLKCGHCQGRLRILAAIHPPQNTRKILDCLGLPARAPPVRHAVPKNQFT